MNNPIPQTPTWKAKHIKGENERIEIRKTIGGTQVLIVVYKKEFLPSYPSWDWNKNDEAAKEQHRKDLDNWYKRHEKVTISMNGKLNLSLKDVTELQNAIAEAVYLLL
jgi:hypothetical protein